MKTDIQLQQDVMTELKWDPKVNAAHIGVQANNGVITLSGHVSNYLEKWEAEAAAKRISGVKAIAVDLEVILANSNKKDDGQLAQDVVNAIKTNTYHLDSMIKAMVEDGIVTLTGVVEWQFQKIAAANAIKDISGIKEIHNQITIRPKISVDAVKSEIDAAINRRALSDIQNVQVHIDGSDITLTGKVHDWSEKNLIVDAAWSSPGVRKVIDQTSFV